MKGRKTTVRVGRATQKPHRILADDAYWNVPFLERYLDRCDEVTVHEPAKAYAMAKPVVELADTRITIRERPGAYRSAIEQRTYRVQARMVRGTTAKNVGALGEAETLYAAAFELAEKGVDTNTRARLHTRYGWLLFVQGNAEAVSQAETAIGLQPDTITLAAAYIMRGAAAYRFEERASGLEHFAQAAALAKSARTTKRGRRVFYAALHGLAKALSESQPTLAASQKAYSLLDEVRAYLAGRPKSAAKMKVYWQMGRIAWNLGYDRHGPRLIQKARRGFRDLGEPFEFALCSLDLAGFYLYGHEIGAYEALAADTRTYLESLEDEKLLEALSVLSRDVPVTPEELRTTRRAVELLHDGE